jgi:hypothetical protein
LQTEKAQNEKFGANKKCQETGKKFTKKTKNKIDLHVKTTELIKINKI